MNKFRNGKAAIVFSIVFLAAISVGFLATQESRDFRIGKNLDIFLSLFRELNTFYVDDINPDKIIKTGIDNMLKTLDPYTVYLPESDADEFSIMTTGKYGGIGCLVRNSGDYAVITDVYKGFPADLAGIKAGDIVRKVDGISLKSIGPDRISEKLKGDPGTDVTLTIDRSGKESDLSMKRARIALPPVPYYGMIDSKTGYIRFTNFTENCIDEVKKALVSLKAQNPDAIILDLRGNPGGLLTEAVEIVNLFVGPGNEVVSTKGKSKQFAADYKTSALAVDERIPLAVIINRGSASASEIVAGAIQDLDRGIIIGQRSYGKGLVQIVRPLSYNTQLKVTTAKYYIPSGRCIQALDYSHPNEDGSVGVIPDSLISVFKTKNGRQVKDGGGIAPDIEVVPETLSQLATELYIRNYIFDFATRYYWSHSDIKSPEQFKLTDQDYSDFKKFLTDRGFSYKTSSEESLVELITNAKKEKIFDRNSEIFNSLEKGITRTLDQDMIAYRNEISQLLSEEIIARYFYEDGAIAWTIKTDDQVKKAVSLLGDKNLYTSILAGKTASIPVKSKNRIFAGIGIKGKLADRKLI
jgi:carboxyl-terminal processing protease